MVAIGVALISALPLLLYPGGKTSAGRVELPILISQLGSPPADYVPAIARSNARLNPAPPEIVIEDSPATAKAPAPDAPKRQAWKQEIVQPGDSLSLIFQRLGLGATDVHEAANAGRDARHLKNLRPGEKVRIRLAADGRLDELEYHRSLLESVTLTRESGKLTSTHTLRDPEIRRSYATGTINNSLFLDASTAGLSDRKIMELAGIFGWDIDFALDLRAGDSFGVLYEEKYLDGERIGEGAILAAYFNNQGRNLTAVRYANSDGSADYFAPDGESMRKAFLRTPVEFARISSHFNLRRRHPILHSIRAHKGVDYAAPRGTPIRAAGDGRVTFAGRKGGYGQTLVIQHGESYSTLYAHLKGFRRGVRNGSRVRQGQIIAYVGSSGLATGPHLHYEFRVNGVHRNPLTVKLPKSTPVPRRELPRFVAATRELVAQIESLRSNPLALNTP